MLAEIDRYLAACMTLCCSHSLQLNHACIYYINFLNCPWGVNEWSGHIIIAIDNSKLGYRFGYTWEIDRTII